SIEEGLVAVRNRFQLLGEVRERRHVIAVDVGVSPYLQRIFLMMRRAVEATADAAVREQLALRERVRAGRQVAGAEQRDDASDVGLEGERGQIELQLDMFVEGFRNARRYFDLGGGRIGRASCR